MTSTNNSQNTPTREFLTCTIKSPPFSYAHLELTTEDDDDKDDAMIHLDSLQVKSYCTAALRQFLGLTGVAIPVDILLVDRGQCWVRVPRPDLGSFAAAITAWNGVTEDGSRRLLRINRCSDWLGVMVGVNGQEQLWNHQGSNSPS